MTRTPAVATNGRQGAERIVRQMHAQLQYYDYLLPGDFVPEPPLQKRWFRWRPAFEITQDMIVWAGTIARARSLMDLEQAAADLIAEEPLVSQSALRSRLKEKVMIAKYVFDISEQRSGEFDTLAGALLYALGNGYNEFSVTRIERRFLRTEETLLVSKTDSHSLIQAFRKHIRSPTWNKGWN